MYLRLQTLIWTTFLVVLPYRTSAGEFRNLGFDDANTNALSEAFSAEGVIYGRGPASALLPGWDIYYGNTMWANQVTLNQLGTFTDFVSINGREHSGGSTGLGFLVENKFAYVASASVMPLALAQQGRVPSDAAVLTYRYFGVAHEVLVNGSPIRSLTDNPYSLQRSRIAQFDISAFTGQEIELRFSSQGGIAFLDSIGFGVPEPSTILLSGLAGLILACRCFCKPRLSRKVSR